MLITHEYTHVLQLDMDNGGYGGVFRTLFGRSPFSFPNAFQPEWLIEGLATYEETAQTSGGRGRSAGADMVLRMATLEGQVPVPQPDDGFPDTWPSGNVPYLFGASFTQYIADKYGRDKACRPEPQLQQQKFSLPRQFHREARTWETITASSTGSGSPLCRKNTTNSATGSRHRDSRHRRP